jgi:hypothetical protein
VSDDPWGLLGQKLRREYNLSFEGDFVTCTLAIADFRDIPLLLSHTAPPDYVVIL